MSAMGGKRTLTHQGSCGSYGRDMWDKKVSVTLAVVFGIGALIGLFVLHNMRIAVPSSFFFGYFFREATFKPSKP